jgi:hypothetical protein
MDLFDAAIWNDGTPGDSRGHSGWCHIFDEVSAVDDSPTGLILEEI